MSAPRITVIECELRDHHIPCKVCGHIPPDYCGGDGSPVTVDGPEGDGGTDAADPIEESASEAPKGRRKRAVAA